jgi:Ca2+-transporting ATPase
LVKDLVVGDVVQLTQGDRVPADCIILDEINLTVDQSAYKKGDNVKKGESQVHHIKDAGSGKEVISDNHKSNPDNILYSDTKIMRGEARAVVCAVGEHTLLSRGRKKEQLVMKQENTELEQKLEKVSEIVGKLAERAALACFAT